MIGGRISPICQVPLSSRDVTCHPLPSKALGQSLTWFSPCAMLTAVCLHRYKLAKSFTGWFSKYKSIKEYCLWFLEVLKWCLPHVMVTSLQCLLEVPGWEPWAMRPSQQPCKLYQAVTVNTPSLQPVSLVLRDSAESRELGPNLLI